MGLLPTHLATAMSGEKNDEAVLEAEGSDYGSDGSYDVEADLAAAAKESRACIGRGKGRGSSGPPLTCLSDDGAGICDELRTARKDSSNESSSGVDAATNHKRPTKTKPLLTRGQRHGLANQKNSRASRGNSC